MAGWRIWLVSRKENVIDQSQNRNASAFGVEWEKIEN